MSQIQQLFLQFSVIFLFFLAFLFSDDIEIIDDNKRKIVLLFFGLCCLIYFGVITYIAVKKSKQSKVLLRKISEKDELWNISHINGRIKVVYFKVQDAWRYQDRKIAKQYMSNRLYMHYKRQIDEMLQLEIRRVMKKIHLKKVTIIEVFNSRGDSIDTFCALIKGSMIDYTVVGEAEEVIDGNKNNRSFKELWHFKRETHGWVLDEIDKNVSISNLRGSKLLSEEEA